MPDFLSYSDKGPRPTNQDRVLSSRLDDERSVYIVADGMGGYAYGEIAAEVAATAIIGFFSGMLDQLPTQETFRKLSSVLFRALRAKAEELSCACMGTTIASAYIAGHEAFLFWIGDARIYHYRNGQRLFQSTDHSFINELRAKGEITPVIVQLYGHIVTRSLNNVKEDAIEFIHTTLRRGDHILLCSDGVHNIVTETQFSSLVNSRPLSLQPVISYCAVRAMDNFSIILISI